MQRPLTPDLFRIVDVQTENHNIFTWKLEPLQPEPSCAFLPGQFNMLYAFGIGEVPISISGDPSHSDQWVHTIRAVGSVTHEMQQLQAGATIGVRGPFGTHWPVEKAEGMDIVLMIGGLGLAPVRPVIYYILAHRKKFGKVNILYGTRTPQDIFFRDELAAWQARKDLDVHVTVDMGLDGWSGEVGLVTDLLASAQCEPLDTVAMVCGPEIMMHFSVLALEKRGISPSSIWLSMERSMKCATGWCGQCQLGPHFICKDGPVFSYPELHPWLQKKEL